MSLKPQTIPPVPDNTATVARAAFPKGPAVLRLRDELGTIYRDELFAALYPERGQPAAAPWRLALVSVLQFLEDLPDRQAAEERNCAVLAMPSTYPLPARRTAEKALATVIQEVLSTVSRRAASMIWSRLTRSDCLR